MEFTIKIEPKDFESVVEQRVKEGVARLIKETADKQVSRFQDKIDIAVSNYLDKKITSEAIADYIDKTIEERLRNLD